MYLITTTRVAAALSLAWSNLTLSQSTLPGSTIVPGPDDRTSRVGTRGANFLHIGIGARAQSMAGAVTATIEGPSALFWNAANIANRESLSAFVSYMRLFGNSGITDIAGGVTVPVGQGALGLSVIQYSSGEMLRTTERAPDGDDPAFPGTFEYGGLAISGHYARNVTDRFTAAVGLRYVRDGIDFAQSNFFGADIATRFRTGLFGLTVGAALMNIGSEATFEGSGIGRAIREPRQNGDPTGRDIPVDFDTKNVQLPTSFRFGVLSSVLGDAEALLGTNPNHSVIAEIDFSDAIDTDIQTAIGVEYGFRRSYFARVGKRFFNEQHVSSSVSNDGNFSRGFSAGGGLRLPFLGRHIALDYAYVMMGDLENNQVISFEFGQ